MPSEEKAIADFVQKAMEAETKDQLLQVLVDAVRWEEQLIRGYSNFEPETGRKARIAVQDAVATRLHLGGPNPPLQIFPQPSAPEEKPRFYYTNTTDPKGD